MKSIHESGHAVVALALHRAVTSATIVAEGSIGGCVEYDEVPRPSWLSMYEDIPAETDDPQEIRHLMVLDGKKTRYDTYRHWSKLMVSLAGAIAAQVFGYRTGEEHVGEADGAGDTSSAQKALIELEQTVRFEPMLQKIVGSTRKEMLHTAEREARRIVENADNKRAIKVLAAELDKRSSLNGHEVKALVGRIAEFISPVAYD